MSNKQVTLSTTAIQVMSEDMNRTSYSIINTDSSIIVYLSDSPTGSSITGMPLYPRQSKSKGKGYGDNTTRAAWAVAASGTPTIAIEEEYGV